LPNRLGKGRSRLALGVILLVSAIAITLIVTSSRDGGFGGNEDSPARRGCSDHHAASFLRRAQNSDGGFGGAPGEDSAEAPTTWAALGLAAAGSSPATVSRDQTSVISYLLGHPPGDDTAALERTILVARAADLSVRDVEGRDLHAALIRQRAQDGSFDRLVNLTAFGVLAMGAAGDPPGARRVRDSIEWLQDQQNADGGFGFLKAPSSSDVDDTAATLQALVTGGHVGGSTVERAVDYLRRAQRADGGFGQRPNLDPNAQSTAWALQALVAVDRRGNRPSIEKASSYLRSLQAADGSVRYSRTSAQTPVWVTGQALLAICRQPLPVPAVGSPGAPRRP
jgi:prenyltransferase beta subunit